MDEVACSSVERLMPSEGGDRLSVVRPLDVQLPHSYSTNRSLTSLGILVIGLITSCKYYSTSIIPSFSMF